MTDDSKQIAELRAEVDKLKASLAPSPDDRAAVGAWRDQMRAASEARASVMHPSVVRDMAVIPDNVVRGVVHDNRAPTGRPGMIPSQHVGDVRTSAPVNTSGWRNTPPLTPPPGVAQADRLMAAEEREFRRQRVIEEAQRRELFKEKKPSE